MKSAAQTFWSRSRGTEYRAQSTEIGSGKAANGKQASWVALDINARHKEIAEEAEASLTRKAEK